MTKNGNEKNLESCYTQARQLGKRLSWVVLASYDNKFSRVYTRAAFFGLFPHASTFVEYFQKHEFQGTWTVSSV